MRGGESWERRRNPLPGADTGGRRQGPALCRRPGRGTGVLEDEERGAAERGPRNPVWERGGAPVSRAPGAGRGRVEETFPFGALVRKCWFPQVISGRRCLGPGLTVLTGVEQQKEEAPGAGLVEQLVKLRASCPDCVLVQGKRAALRAKFLMSHARGQNRV